VDVSGPMMSMYDLCSSHEDVMSCDGWDGALELSELLIGFTFCNNLGGIIDDRRPIEPLSKDFCCEGSGTNVPPAHA
jgi:hypothetical protein